MKVLQEQKEKNHDDEKPKITGSVVVIGAERIGKTMLVKSLTNQPFSNQYCPTLGVDFFERTVMTKEDGLVGLKIWDASGEEGPNDIGMQSAKAFYKDSDVVLCVLGPEPEKFKDYKNFLKRELHNNHLQCESEEENEENKGDGPQGLLLPKVGGKQKKEELDIEKLDITELKRSDSQESFCEFLKCW